MDGMSQPNFMTIDEALDKLKGGALRAEALVEACSRQIGRLNPDLNAFITVVKPELHPAKDAARRLNNIPVAVKDLFDTRGIRTTGGTSFFRERVPESDAAAVERLREAGAVIMGKTNTHEIALGVTTVNPHFGACHNPWDTARIPGGSSGGSAAAVAAGMALAALGTDTGGSIRIPASLCGVVGLKPSYGRVSVRGVMPLSWNLDHVGPLTRSVKDAARMLQVLAGYDPEDPYSEDWPVEDYSADIEQGVRGRQIALAVGSYAEDADSEVLRAVEEAAKVFAGAGAIVERVDVSFLREAAIANGIMTPADGAAYHRERLAEHPEGFGEDVRQRLQTGRDFSATEYALARKTQSDMRRRMREFFSQYDVLMLPSTPATAPLIEGGDAVTQARKLTRFTAPFNLTGLPAISVPCGFDKAGLPIGLQLVAGRWKEAALLQAARAYEREAGLEHRHPPMAEA